MAKKKKVQKTTRDTSFNYSKDVATKTISSLVSYNTSKEFKNVRLMGVEDGVSVTGQKIKDHAAANTTMSDLGYEGVVINTDDITSGNNYKIYGAPFQAVLNNRQHYNNCGVESTLNNLAMAGIVKMKENLSDQKSVENSFLKAVWTLGLVQDSGVIGKLDEADGGTMPDDYRDIFRQYDIDSEAYYVSRKCDGTQYGTSDKDLNELGYKISQGYGAVLGVCSSKLWQEQKSETGDITIDHAVSIVGVVYADGVDPAELDDEGKYKNAPTGFYIHDTGAWMTRFISLEEFKSVTLYEEHGMSWDDYQNYIDYDEEHPLTQEQFEALYDPDKYLENMRDFDSELREYLGKKPNGIMITITNEPIKSDLFNLNATGDKQDNKIWGNSGDNVIKGMDGKDTLYGNAGDDEIRGGKGDDVIIGNKLALSVKNYLTAEYGFLLDNVDAYNDEVIDDYTTGMNMLYGDAGNDTIIGGDDIDLIYGGAGNDYIYGGNGRNAVYGGKGNDVILGGWDNDRLFGDAGNDIIYGFGDADTIHGGDGNDKIYAGSGNDIVETGKGTDIVYFEGTEHGLDEISSQGGTTTFQFIDEVYDGVKFSDGAKISDMEFQLAKNEENEKMYDLTIAYTPDIENAKDAVVFESFFNYKKGKQKTLDIVDVNSNTYKVSASKAKTVKASTGNNVMFSLRDQGAAITTGAGNDIVTMVETEDIMNIRSESALVYDAIKYAGGIDRYMSEERNTYYSIDGGFGANTTLAIYDNMEALEKVVLGPNGDPMVKPDGTYITEKVVSTDDRLYTNTEKSNLNFFFDVGLNEDKGFVTEFDGLFILNSMTSDDAAKLKSIANDDDNISGYIYMNGFFNEQAEFTGTGFYGNGRIETIYYNEDTAYGDLTDDLRSIASDVASWLNTNGYSSAFNAFKDEHIDPTDLADLIACYNLNQPT